MESCTCCHGGPPTTTTTPYHQHPTPDCHDNVISVCGARPLRWISVLVFHFGSFFYTSSGGASTCEKWFKTRMLGPSSHRTRKQICTQICMQTLWCCVQPVWTLPFAAMCPIACVVPSARCSASCVNGTGPKKHCIARGYHIAKLNKGVSRVHRQPDRLNHRGIFCGVFCGCPARATKTDQWVWPRIFSTVVFFNSSFLQNAETKRTSAVWCDAFHSIKNVQWQTNCWHV